MAVSLRDRQRVAELVIKEFREKHAAATRMPSDLDVQIVQDRLMKSLRMTKTASELEAAQHRVEELKKKLALAVRAAKPETMVMDSRTSRRWDGCECTGDYREMLKEIATHLATNEVRSGDDFTSIEKQQRRLLAKIEVAETTADLSAIMKSAGLM